MKWQAAVVGALASAFIATAAFAEVHIVNDPGGEVSEYVQKFHELRKAGEHLVIDGPCLSACTLFTGIIPHDHVCVTRRAVLGFHAASYFDDARHTLVPTRQGTQVIMRLYPPEIRDDTTAEPSGRKKSVLESKSDVRLPFGEWLSVRPGRSRPF